jgi:hypothetical protein
VLYLHGDIFLSRVGADFTKVLFGAYATVGRLDDIPVNLTPDIPELERNDALRKLRALGSSVGGRDGIVGFIQPEDRQGTTARPVSAGQRAAWAKEGAAMIEAAVKAADIRTVSDALRDHQRFTRQYLIPKYEHLLP